MRESQFDAQQRLNLHDRYFPHGVWWNNKTGYAENYHAPFGGKGGGDLIGCLLGLWIEFENKARKGTLRKEQIIRRELVTKCGGLYIVCKEVGFVLGDFDAGFVRACVAIESHVARRLGVDAIRMMKLKPLGERAA